MKCCEERLLLNLLLNLLLKLPIFFKETKEFYRCQRR